MEIAPMTKRDKILLYVVSMASRTTSRPLLI